jgi:hypothetical protein
VWSCLRGHGACSQNAVMGSLRVALGFLCVVGAGVGGAIACSNYVPPDVANYGPPNGIDGKQPNGPGTSSGSGSSSGSSSSGGSSGDGGTSSGGTPTVTYACGTPIDGGPCAVSWSQTIYPAMQAGGAWGCAGGSSCHTVIQPTLSGSASAVYTTMANYTGINNLPYFNPCSTDPTKSTFVCNTATTTCSVQMPTVGGTGAMTDAGLAEIAAWVACGAPQN